MMIRLNLRGIAVVGMIALSAVACGGPTAPDLVSLSGHWEGQQQGTFKESGVDQTSTFAGTLSFDLVESAGKITGTGVVSNRLCGGTPCSSGDVSLTITGTVTGTSIELSAPYCVSTSNGPKGLPITYDGTLSSQPTISGQVTVCTLAHGQGTFTLTKR